MNNQILTIKSDSTSLYSTKGATQKTPNIFIQCAHAETHSYEIAIFIQHSFQLCCFLQCTFLHLCQIEIHHFWFASECSCVYLHVPNFICFNFFYRTCSQHKKTLVKRFFICSSHNENWIEWIRSIVLQNFIYFIVGYKYDSYRQLFSLKKTRSRIKFSINKTFDFLLSFVPLTSADFHALFHNNKKSTTLMSILSQSLFTSHKIILS